jgi:hypothetical protein
MIGWLRRNWIALAAVVVLVPATLALTFSAEWGRYYAERPIEPVVVERGEPADFAGTGWRVADVRRVAADSAPGVEAGAPAGTDLVLVTIAVKPRELDAEGRSPGCGVQLAELRGDDVVRTWKDANYSVDHVPAHGVETICTPDLTAGYRFETVFVVPRDTGDELVVDLELVNELPRFLRLAL